MVLMTLRSNFSLTLSRLSLSLSTRRRALVVRFAIAPAQPFRARPRAIGGAKRRSVFDPWACGEVPRDLF
jgi:hypothetical protein